MTVSPKPNAINPKVSGSDRIHFAIIRLVHETLYGLFRDPREALDAAGLKPGQTVLEVGCGPGFFTLPAAQMVGARGRVYAVDINPLATELVQRKIETAGVSNAEILLADAAQTALPTQSFDLVFVFGLGHAVGSLEDIFAEVYRLLKPAGILAVEGRLQPPKTLFSPLKRQGNISQFRKVA